MSVKTERSQWISLKNPPQSSEKQSFRATTAVVESKFCLLHIGKICHARRLRQRLSDSATPHCNTSPAATRLGLQTERVYVRANIHPLNNQSAIDWSAI